MMRQLERREFVQLGGLATAGAALAAVLPIDTAAAQSSAAPKPTDYVVKPLPFDPKTIKGLSEKILTSHHENNYTGAVKRLNAITEQLAGLDYGKAPVFVVNGLKREQLIAINSMILHEFYFAGLGEESQPGAALADAMARDFGGVERWRAEFVAMGKAEGGGSGWVILAWSPRDKRLINAWAADHTTNLAGGQPILVLDMYEHAYHMDYGAKAGAYVEAFMRAIRWSNADQLYERHRRG
ncbi:MAG: Fe-Mn family superoxide dismutase [Stellaceae bacterium]